MSEAPIYTYFIMPAGFLRLGADAGGGDTQKIQSFYLPVDDGHCARFEVTFQTGGSGGGPGGGRPPHDGELKYPKASDDFGRNYDGVDSISGIPPTPRGYFRAQDTMATETQGFPVVDRTTEHLGAHDFILTAMRMMILMGISDVRNGLDPKHVIRDPQENGIVCIRGEDPLEFFRAEREALGVG
ncbi:MAG: hypothetical protein GEU73_04655 [Chloroflexi bacterium]|nr:hypothetical protein [Chloroflexota bacterium]